MNDSQVYCQSRVLTEPQREMPLPYKAVQLTDKAEFERDYYKKRLSGRMSCRRVVFSRLSKNYSFVIARFAQANRGNLNVSILFVFR